MSNYITDQRQQIAKWLWRGYGAEDVQVLTRGYSSGARISAASFRREVRRLRGLGLLEMTISGVWL